MPGTRQDHMIFKFKQEGKIASLNKHSRLRSGSHDQGVVAFLAASCVVLFFVTFITFFPVVPVALYILAVVVFVASVLAVVMILSGT